MEEGFAPISRCVGAQATKNLKGVCDIRQEKTHFTRGRWVRRYWAPIWFVALWHMHKCKDNFWEIAAELASADPASRFDAVSVQWTIRYGVNLRAYLPRRGHEVYLVHDRVFTHD